MIHHIETIATQVFKEARHEGLSEMEAVACTLVNQAKKGLFHPPACPKHTFYNKEITAHPLFQIAHRITVRAFNGLLKDPTKGATRYHKITQHPSWAHKLIPCAQSRCRLFYKGESYAGN